MAVQTITSNAPLTSADHRVLRLKRELRIEREAHERTAEKLDAAHLLLRNCCDKMFEIEAAFELLTGSTLDEIANA